MSQMSSSGWLLAFIISLLLSLLMGLALVWLSIERTDKAYSIRQLRNEVEQRAVLKTKLEVERDRLLAPLSLTAFDSSPQREKPRPHFSSSPL